jgi:hypothetical protein
MVTQDLKIIFADLKLELDAGYWQAGQDYLDALKKLGLDPEALLWAYDEVIESWVLILVTPVYDIAGSLTFAKTLFKAYNLAATPKEISPFILRLHSPDQTIIRNLDAHIERIKQMTKNIDIPEKEHIGLGHKGNLYTQLNFIYKFELKKKNRETQMRQWKRFNDNVEKLERLAA